MVAHALQYNCPKRSHILYKRSIEILYVEEDPSTQEFVKLLFKEIAKVDVTYAKNGKEAWNLYEQKSYDIVITDIQMPQINGFELLEQILQHNSKQLCAVASAMEDKKDFIKAINLQVHYFLQKPLCKTSFEETLQKLIERANQQRASQFNEVLLKQYKNAVDTTTILSKSDLKGKITFVNEKFCELSQYTKEELIGKSHSLLRHQDMPKETFKQMWRTIQNRQIWKGKIKNKAKDGTAYIVDATIIPVLDNSNNIIEYIGLRYDITELEQYKELLEKSLDNTELNLAQKVHMLAEYEKAINESATFTRTDKYGKIIHVNDNFCKINGYTKEELLGKSHNIIRHPDMPKVVFKELWRTIKAKKIWRGILKNLTKNGQTTHMNTTIVPILNIKGEIVEYMSIRFEVTDLINLHEEIESTQKEIVYKMGEIGESRSQETGNHVKRVAEYSKLLATLYGLDYKEAEILFTASPMHDIGKVGIEDRILKKPGKLDAKEWEVMKTHATIGYEILKNSQREVLKAAAIVSHEHHEKYDGSGYPRGLKAQEIHIYGRITAVADVFDALGSDRCYKKAWELDKILELFEEQSGKHFDPTLVKLMFDNLEDFLVIKEKYQDTM